MPEVRMVRELKAVVLDLDGTLYRQDVVRRGMARRLLLSYVKQPHVGWRVAKTLRAYRRAQELLRLSELPGSAHLQVEKTSRITGESRTFVEDCVQKWMEETPLPFLSRAVQPGLIQFLQTCKDQRLRLAVLSDYPAEDKLRALGVRGLFDEVICAQSPDVGAFKPNPTGLNAVLRLLGVSPDQCLYVGDRVDVDLPAAQAAGVACAILSRGDMTQGNPDYIQFQSYRQLEELLFNGKHETGPKRALRLVSWLK